LSGCQPDLGSLIPAAPIGARVLVLTRPDLEEVLDMRTVIDAVERGLVEQARGTVSMPARQIHTIDGSGTTFVMSAYLGGMEALALKVVSEFRGNRDRGIPSIQGAVLLLDAETGEILSLMDGATITALRTGAAGALAARTLSVVDAQVAGILGTGTQARTQIQGLWVVRDLQLVKAYSPTKAHVRAFCEEIADQLEVDALVADKPREVVEGSDVVITATNATEPVLPGAWLEEGVHVTSIGGGTVRELDAEVYRRARVVVDWREGALEEARDIREAIDNGAFSPDDIEAELGELVAGMKKGRISKDEITLFRSVGMALEDATTAFVAYERAEDAGIGTRVVI
jgi:ornithine cyclodeaminase/alanine dehydrogenase